MALKLAFGGCVFDDLNGDGIVLAQDANGTYTDQEEPGLAGVIVRVFDSHGNHIPFLNENAELVTSITTDERGFYKIFNLAEGCDYKLQFDYSNLSDAGDRTLSPANVVVPQFIGQGGSEGKDSDAVRSITDTLAETDFLTPGVGGSNKVNLGLKKDDPGDARLGNFVFEDLNRNGIQDRGEVGIAGIEVTLTGAGADGEFGTADDISRTKRTSGRGFYSFGHLKAGDYKVTFDSTDDFEFTQANVGSNEGRDSDADVTTGMTDVISLAASERNLKVDAGLIRKDGGSGPVDTNDARLGNFVFEDTNSNGIQDKGETGVAGVTVSLLGAGADGQFGTADDIQRTTTTSSRGFYNFGGLSAGDYKVTFEQPTGFEFTDANVGDHEGRDSDADVNTGMTDVISLSVGERNLKVDAGLVKSAPVDPSDAKIGNLVFEDVNRNGLQDAGETGVAGVSISLLGAGADGQFGTADDITQSGSTNQDGFYQFNNLTAGNYKVTFDQLSGFEFTTANVGDNEGTDSDADVATGMTEAIALAQSERNFKVDAGLVRQNNAPTAIDDSESTAFETPVNISVLGNDSDPDGDRLSVTSLNGQTINIGETVDVGNGTVTLLENGQFSFTPDAGFSGEETFSYHVSDGNGSEDTANVTVTVAPRPRKDIHASIVGAGGIDEGKSSFYKVQLDHAVTEDTIFTLDVHDGSAERVDRNDSQAANQDIMWGGYYSVGYVNSRGQWVRLAYKVDNRVANGTSLSSGDRAQVGPDGYTTWDYTVEKHGHVQNDGKVSVLVRAGQTMSEQFEVQTWKEKVTVDRAPWSVSTGYYEGTEDFSIKITGTSGNDADDISLGNNKSVNIFDKTHYDFVSPLALDLNGDGVQTVALGETEGTFDLNGDGTAIESGWLSSEDAFLAVDNNGNGKIDDISELFGGEVGEGFAKLATYDTNNDGVIDSEEILGGGLTLWQDANSNHRTDADELISLASQGIASLDTAFVETPIYQNGNVLIEHGSATKVDGSKIDLVDAYFQVADTSASANVVDETVLSDAF